MQILDKAKKFCGVNTPAYLPKASAMQKNSFITLAPCFDVIKHFFSLSLTIRTNQQGCLQLVSFYSLVYYLWYVQEPICDTLRFSPWTNSFLTNIRLGCVCFLGTYTLAYLPEAMKKKKVFYKFSGRIVSITVWKFSARTGSKLRNLRSRSSRPTSLKRR